jgi:PQQ-dependent dehydrogenase (methanol/ethanol family)
MGVNAPARRADDATPQTRETTREEWPTYGLDAAETRYSPLTQIDATNVGRLGLAWSYDVPYAGPTRAPGTPIVANGVLYSATHGSVTFALDARTGKEIWRYQPSPAPRLPPGGFRGTPRGLAIFRNKIIVPVLDGRLVALSATTGAELWSVQTTPVGAGDHITLAPRIVGRNVVIGNSGGEAPVRGFVSAYDADSGRLAWRFYTVPGDPASGLENSAMERAAKTWSGEWYRLGGGGTVWDAVSYDAELNLVYFGTGNGGPWPEQLRHSRGQDNLYIASVVALAADTGAYRWHYQFTPGDSWDYDATQQLTLADLRIEGRTRKVIMQANKNGFFYVLDRTDGSFISGEPYARVNWARGIDPAGRPRVNPDARYGEQPVCILPGSGGPHTIEPMSFNPRTGLVYVPIQDPSGETFSVDSTFAYTPGQNNTGTRRVPGIPCPPTASDRPSGEEAKAVMPTPLIGPVRTLPDGHRFGNWLIAWDPVSQAERWRVLGSGTVDGGTVTTASDLVLLIGRMVQGSARRSHLRAHAAADGKLLADVELPDAFNLGPPITFMADGTQYVVVPLVVDVAPGETREFRPRLYAFRVDGTTPLPRSGSRQ